MAIKSLAPIYTLLQEQRADVSAEWLNEITHTWERKYPGQVNRDEIRSQSEALLRELASVFSDAMGATAPDISTNAALVEVVRELSSECARKGFKPVDTAQYIISLKNVMTRHLLRNLGDVTDDLAPSLRVLDDVLDRLSLLTFEIFVEIRERVIAQQSLSLMELSTPVILLWNNVLLIPLVGVIDTVRGRQFTERMLEAISRHEARVTIIDVTGVPVFDTSVARHIMKAVDAAQLLGSRIVMTGISPEGAQTLTKLNVSFSSVTSRATLRAGVAEALLMVGRRIETINGARP